MAALAIYGSALHSWLLPRTLGCHIPGYAGVRTGEFERRCPMRTRTTRGVPTNERDAAIMMAAFTILTLLLALLAVQPAH